MHYRRIGIVLSSGGGRGVYGHTGFLLALHKLDIKIEAMSGCSAGAIVGSVAASGGNIIDWSEALKKIKTDQFWTPRSKLKILQNLILHKGRGFLGLSDSKAAIELITRYLGANTFEECAYPFYAAALNIGSGEKVVFDSNELAPRVFASAAMPVFYDPIEIDGEYYSDGAIVDLAPAEAICCKHKLDLLIVHHLANRNYTVEDFKRSFNQPWPIAGILHRSIYHYKPWYATGKAMSEHNCPCGCNARILVLEPALPELVWPVTRGGKDIMESAEKQTLNTMNLFLKHNKSSQKNLS